MHRRHGTSFARRYEVPGQQRTTEPALGLDPRVLRCARNDNMLAAMEKLYWVYIIASRPHGALYIGITSNLGRRIHEHRIGIGSEHADRYRIWRLVYAESFPTA